MSGRTGSRIATTSWDPFHGDLNNRFPRLGAPVRRRHDSAIFRTAGLGQPALYGNGLWDIQDIRDDVLTVLRRRFGAEIDPSIAAAAA